MKTSAILLTVAGVVACGGDQPKVPAATVSKPVAESDLTTVRLSSEAFGRLGIETVAVESTTVPLTRTWGGEVTVPPGRTITVTAPVAGTVLGPVGGAIPAAGRRVGRRQALLRLVALPTDRDLLAAESRLRQAEAEAERVARLHADRLVSARENDQAQAELAAARATHQASRATRDGAPSDSANLTALVITSPEAGIVRSLHVAAGQAVAAGTPLTEVVTVDGMWVRVPVYAGSAADVAPGPAAIQVLGQHATGPVIEATPVASPPPTADAQAASVDLFYELRGATTLRPGERVTVTVPLRGPSERALVVPLTAILHDLNGGAWVYQRLDSLAFARRRVEVSRVVNGRAVLARGPAPGTIIVTAGAAELFGTEFGAGK